MKIFNGNSPKWLSFVFTLIAMIFAGGIWYNQTQVYGKMIDDNSESIVIIKENMDDRNLEMLETLNSIDKRLCRIEWKLEEPTK